MRTVRQEPEVDAIVDFAAERWTRGQDAWDAVTWALARDPEVGVPVTQSGRTRAFTLAGAVSVGLPTTTVIYILSDEFVTIVDAHFC